MPGLSGSMVAYKPALSGIARSGASRSGAFTPTPLATIGGVRCEPKILTETLSIRDQLPSGGNTAQKTCSFRLTAPVAGVATLVGADVQLYLGSLNGGLLFGGTIVKSQLVYLGPALVYTDVTVDGYGFLLNRRLVNKSYVALSITAIVADLLTTFASGYTPALVQAGLPAVTIAFAMTTLSDALTQLAVIADAIWFVDDHKQLALFTPGNDPRTPPATVTNGNTLSLSLTDDIQPTRTRIYAAVQGSGTSVAAATFAGALVIPVKNAYPFAPSGQLLVSTPVASGVAAEPIISRTDLVSYSGVSHAALVAPMTVAPSITVSWGNSTGGLTSGATYTWGFTFVTANGETTVSPLISSVATNNTATLTLTAFPPFYQVLASGFVVPVDNAIIAINVYRTIGNGSQLFFQFAITAATAVESGGRWQWLLIWNDSTDDVALGAPAPLYNTAAQGQTSTTGNGTLASTSLFVADVTMFDPAGGYAIVGTNTVVQYTSYVITNPAAGPAGHLVLTAGLPMSVPAAPITATPALTGVAASPPGSIPVLLPSGAALTPFVQLDNGPAQTALAALEGGDGIQEFYLADGSALTAALATTIGTADLALWDSVVSTVTIETRAPQMAAGVPVTVTTGTPASRTLAGLTAHTVTIDRFTPRLFPIRTVEASTVPTAVTLEGLLTQIGRPVQRLAN